MGLRTTASAGDRCDERLKDDSPHDASYRRPLAAAELSLGGHNLHEANNAGVLRYGDEASSDATAAWIRYERSEHRVLVRNGHFLFVAWNTDFHEDPELVRFE
jgi:hypothetical protein